MVLKINYIQWGDISSNNVHNDGNGAIYNFTYPITYTSFAIPIINADEYQSLLKDFATSGAPTLSGCEIYITSVGEYPVRVTYPTTAMFQYLLIGV